MPYVYRYSNRVNDKSYIGVTRNLKQRKYSHSRAQSDSKFHRAIRKHGIENFFFEILKETETWEEALRQERKFVSEFDSRTNGYNSTDGGDGGPSERRDAYHEGEITYFTGQPCKNGHTSLRYTRSGLCSECAKKRAREQREDKESYNEYHREYSGKNVHLLKKYLRDPNEYLFEKRTRQRKALKQATPLWANLDAIRSVYAHCVYLNETMHFPMEVDHVIPLHNRIVCGLHVPENLQVSSHTLNTQKGNTFNRVKAEKELMKWIKERGL